MRESVTLKRMTLVNAVLMAVLIWTIATDRPIFSSTADAAGAGVGNAAAQRAEMIEELRTMSRALEQASKDADKRQQELIRFLESGKAKYKTVQ